MHIRHSFLAAVAGASVLAACTSPAPSAPPVDIAASPAASPEASAPASPAAEARAVRIRALVAEHALAGASVTVRLASDLSVVADGLKLDEQGMLSLPLDDRLKPGVVVVVQAKAGSSILSGLFTVATAYAVQQTSERSEWLLDLATSAVTRKLTSKLADVLRSLPPGGDASAITGQVNVLIEQTREAVRSGLRNTNAAVAIRQAIEQPTSEHIEALANDIIRYSSLRSAFAGVVEACNRQAFDSMAAGGPLVVPARWQVFDLVVQPPQIRAVGDGIIELVMGDQKVTLAVSDARQKVADAEKRATDSASNQDFAAINTSVVVTRSSGGGGSSQPPSLRGTISVAGVVRHGALVQLSDMTGAVVAKTSSASDGTYAFYNIPDGTYQLIVAVDGAVQSSRIVTIGTPL